MSALVIGIKGTKLGNGNRKSRDVEPGNRHYKVGVLVIEIKATKYGKSNRESRDVAKGEGTLRWLS